MTRGDRDGRGRRGRRRCLLVAALLAGGALAACDSSGGSSSGAEPTEPATSSSSTPVHLPKERLTFGVSGNAEEIAAYQQMATLFAPLSRQVTVKVESWPDHTAMLDDLEKGARVPDVLLASRRDLVWLQEHQQLQPVDGLLDDRGVDFGDDYPRDLVNAFGSDNRLMCLPYGVTPSVIFYNKKLVDFRRMANDPPQPGQGWSLDQFAHTARWAVRHHPGVSGMYVDPTLSGLAPFLYSAGGQLFDDQQPPTSLAFSTPDTQSALSEVLAEIGRSSITLSPKRQLRRTPEEWFEDGKLALLEGDRSLVPRLRAKLGFEFDVMPMPTIDQPRTVGGLTGLCVSRHARDTATAADFVDYAGTPEALRIVADAGYLQPANQSVALSQAFQQPGHNPQHASVFTFAVKSMVIPPTGAFAGTLEQEVDPLVAQLFDATPAQIAEISRRIDRLSQRLLAASATGTGSQSPSPSP